MTIQFANKLVAVLNEKIEPGVVMNALAHMCIGFGSSIGQKLKSETVSKIRALRQAAEEKGIRYANFTDTMTVGTYIEQLERTKNTKEADLVYYGIVLLGDWAAVSEMTRKFSLYK